MAANETRKSALLESGLSLQCAQTAVREATATSLETEDTGFHVLADLANQREAITRSTGHMNQVDQNLTGARNILEGMVWRSQMKKLALICLVVTLTVLLVVLIFYQFLPLKN